MDSHLSCVRPSAHQSPPTGNAERLLLPSVQVKAAVDEALEWLDDNQDAEEEEYKEKLKEVEDVCNPVVSAAYAAGGGAPGGDDEDDLGDHDEL